MNTSLVGTMSLALVMLAALPAAAQRKTLAGRVTDARTGQPVSAGLVRVEGTALRDALRPDGVFVLDVDRRGVTLLVEGRGYLSRQIYVSADQETVLIELRGLAHTLEDAHVLGEAPDAQRALVATDIDRVPAATIAQQLTGRLGGVEIQQNSGVPGDIALQLRGVSTLLGSSQPLFVVDGVLVNSSTVPSGASLVTGGQETGFSRIADLNPRDIETIRVLRGAAATAQYGSRGANGVIIIRTKRGR